ncbi:MAG: flavodoxin domain-containing protein [Chloroflexi bacterium]|nr:flavodoxin domain-containing protein [Chloroflexota bacterium]
MQILVLYQSRSGHTRQAAEAISAAARNLGHSVATKSVIEVRQADVEQAELLFVGTWIQGFILFGVKPAGADLWVPALPSLAGKPVAMFCTYAFNPRRAMDRLSDLLKARGATVVGQNTIHRSRPGDGAEDFVRQTLSALSPT